jgi:hypothetical protein
MVIRLGFVGVKRQVVNNSLLIANHPKPLTA